MKITMENLQMSTDRGYGNNARVYPVVYGAGTDED